MIKCEKPMLHLHKTHNDINHLDNKKGRAISGAALSESLRV
jgi:hypothetical protein